MGRLQNILVQEPRLIHLMKGLLGDGLDARVNLCEMVLPSYQIFLRRLEHSGDVLHLPSNEVMQQMVEILSQNGVNPRLLGRLVEDFGLNGISYYVKAPNPHWLSDPDSYLELLKVLPESRVDEALELAVSVAEKSKRRSFLRVFRELGSAGIVVTKAARAGHKIAAAEVAAIRYAREFGSEGTAFLENTPLERWVSEARLLKHRREGAADRVAYEDCRRSGWTSKSGLDANQLINQARKNLGVVRLGRLRHFEERDPHSILQHLARSLYNFKHAPSEGKEVVVLVASRADHNAAFRELWRQFDNLAATCHPVLIEGDNLEEVLTRVTILRANHMQEGHMKPISGICFLGHGNSESIELSSRALINHRSTESLAELGTHLAPNGEVFFEACLVGHRSEGADSLADTVAKAIPHCRIHACPTIRFASELSWVPEIGFVESGTRYKTARIGPYERLLRD